MNFTTYTDLFYEIARLQSYLACRKIGYVNELDYKMLMEISANKILEILNTIKEGE